MEPEITNIFKTSHDPMNSNDILVKLHDFDWNSMNIFLQYWDHKTAAKYFKNVSEINKFFFDVSTYFRSMFDLI